MKHVTAVCCTDVWNMTVDFIISGVSASVNLSSLEINPILLELLPFIQHRGGGLLVLKVHLLCGHRISHDF